MKKYVCAFILVLAFLFTSSLFAANRAGTATVLLGAGYYDFASKRHVEDTDLPLLALGYNFTDHWGVEGLVSLFHATSNNPPYDGKQVSGTLFLFDGVYHFTPFYKEAIQPFVLAGVGMLGLSPNGNDARDEGNINAGIGVQLFASNNIALRLEGRDLYTIVGGKNDVLLDAGVSFLFDL